jgi:hypothetical protein
MQPICSPKGRGAAAPLRPQYLFDKIGGARVKSVDDRLNTAVIV